MEASGLIGAGSALVSSVGGIFIAAKDASERRKLEEQIAKLSLKQQKELAEKQEAAKTEVEKMRLFYQYLALVKHEGVMASLDKTKYTGLIAIGVGITILGIIIIVVRKKQSNG